jgi:hypothetical protein
MRSGFVAIAALVSILVAVQARADPAAIGRYQAIALPRGADDLPNKIMILDTVTGDLWQWWERPSSPVDFGPAGITYMGRVAPGSAAGATRTFRHFPSSE